MEFTQMKNEQWQDHQQKKSNTKIINESLLVTTLSIADLVPALFIEN